MMKKFIRNNPKITKSVYGAVVGVAFQLSFQFASSILSQLILILLTVLLYAAPLIYNIEIIKRYETSGVKTFIQSDLLFHFAPALLASLFTEIIFVIATAAPAYTAGMGSLIYLCITVLLTGCFWLGYIIINTIYK